MGKGQTNEERLRCRLVDQSIYTYISRYKKVGVLTIRIVKSNVQSVGPSSERNRVPLQRRANAQNVRLYYPYWQYTNLFIFRFVSLLSLRSTLRLFHLYILL